MSSQIPVVDFSRWSNTNDSTERLSLAKSLVSACQQVGFVYIVNHGLDPKLLDNAFETSKRLFALKREDKMRAPHPDGPAVHRGYSHPGLEKVSQYAGGEEEVGEQLREITDCKESYEIGSEQLREITDCKESYEIGSEQNHDQPNVWLPESTLPGFKQATSLFYWKCNEVAQSILQALAIGIGLDDSSHLTRHHSGHNNQLRLLHYPPVAAADLESEKVARMPAHSDWSTITLLFQDDCGGLEIEDPQQAGKFVPATPMDGACVMNVGDLLMRWSNDTLKSTLHRVTLPPLADRIQGEERMTRERYSIVYFVGADPNAVVECLPACVNGENPPKYEPITQQAYCEMRSKVQYRNLDSTVPS